MKKKKKLLRLLLAEVVGAWVAASGWTALAAEAWVVPEAGVRLEAGEKQTYMADKMAKFFRQNPKSTATFAAPDGWIYESYDLGDVKAERLANPVSESRRVVLQLHGGGYISGLDDGYRELCVKQMVMADAREAYTVDYRLAPKHTYPAALEDAVAIYEDILARGTEPQEIVVFGDSAGGNLALELSLYLREHQRPQPGALVLISPWTTLETNFPSRKNNADRDLILGKINSVMYNEVKKPSYGKGLSSKDPRVSPIYANLQGLPPMLIQTGGYELFLDEDMELMKKAAGDNVDVTFTVYPGMSHVFAILLPELQDSVDSFREIRDFVNRHVEN